MSFSGLPSGGVGPGSGSSPFGGGACCPRTGYKPRHLRVAQRLESGALCAQQIEHLQPGSGGKAVMPGCAVSGALLLLLSEPLLHQACFSAESQRHRSGIKVRGLVA